MLDASNAQAGDDADHHGAGVIQYVHPGKECHEADGSEDHAMCANDMVGIRAAIERLPAEPVGARRSGLAGPKSIPGLGKVDILVSKAYTY